MRGNVCSFDRKFGTRLWAELLQPAFGSARAIDKDTPPQWELSDVIKDPHEMNNVYDDPKLAAVRRNSSRSWIDCWQAKDSRRNVWAIIGLPRAV